MKLGEYIKGTRRGPEAHGTELEAMRDPLLGDAIEGFDAVDGDHDEALGRLQARLSERVGAETRRRAHAAKRKRLVVRWSAAAALLLCAGTGLLLYLQDDEISNIPPIAQESGVKQEALPEEPALPSVAEEKGESPPAKKKIAAMSEILGSPEIKKMERRREDPQPVSDDTLADTLFLASPPRGSKTPEPAGSVITIRLAGKSRVAGTRTISGRVVDAGSGQPLAGSTVIAAGTTLGTTTDAEGYFTLAEVPDSTAHLSVAYLGYKNKMVGTDSSSLIAMEESGHAISEVIVVGYGNVISQTFTAGAVLISDSTAPSPGVKVSAEPVIESVIVTGYSTSRKKTPSRAEPVADSLQTMFDRYVAEKKVAAKGITGQVVLEFDVDEHGRPVRIRTVEHVLPEAERLAKRLLREGPAWEVSRARKRIVINFDDRN